jgi:hypothetical protein
MKTKQHPISHLEFKEYEVGDFFYQKRIANRFYKNDTDEVIHKLNAKLQYRWTDPYIITKKLSPVVYEADVHNKKKIVHAVNMRTLAKNFGPASPQNHAQITLVTPKSHQITPNYTMVFLHFTPKSHQNHTITPKPHQITLFCTHYIFVGVIITPNHTFLHSLYFRRCNYHTFLHQTNYSHIFHQQIYGFLKWKTQPKKFYQELTSK